MKKLKKRIMFYLGMLLMTMCLFFCNTTTQAKTITVTDNVMISSADGIPTEVTEPIEKGKKLLAYLVISLGVIAALIGVVFLGIAFLGHQPDMRIQGFIWLGVGLLIANGTIIVNWLLGNDLF